MGTSVDVRAVTDANLDDLQDLAAANGRFGWCSCMRWRMPSTEFRDSTKGERRAALESLVTDHEPVGLLAYDGGEVVGWCSLAPREQHGALLRSRTIPRPEGEDVWSIVCVYLVPRVRRSGVQHALLAAAVDEARARGAGAIEGYPVPAGAESYRWMGTVEVFRELGFADVTPAGAKRSVLRRTF